MARPKKLSVDRRDFLKTAVGGTAALTAATHPAAAQEQAQNSRPAGAPLLAKETDPPSSVEVLTADHPGSDFMVDVFKSLGFEYVCANPGSSFRALHESIVNYGGNNSPEFITCCHEESSIAMAHGTVGLQHASMAIYNAYCDHAPVYIVVGNSIDAVSRRPGVEWAHSVQDAASLVRDFVKWDDLPISLGHFAESAVRAYKIAMTPPMMPVLLVADGDLQETPVSAKAQLHIPKLSQIAMPQGDVAAVGELARMLVDAQNPVIIADRCARTSAGMKLLAELAETPQAPVINQGGRMNLPSRHPLNQTDSSRGLIANADVILGLEVWDFWGTINSYRDQLERSSRPITKTGVKLVSITSTDLYTKSNYQDFQRYTEADLAIAADAEATLPSLIESSKRLITSDRKRAFEERGKKLAAAHQEALERARAEATYGWDVSPISTARMAAELWAQIKDKDWSLVSGGAWAQRLWNFDKYYQFIGGSGGAGVGYGAPAALGAALANKKHGRLSVNIQNDGDLMYAPGVLWTSAHHHIPLLSVMHNNRSYHQEIMGLQKMANRRQRGIDRTHIGVTLDDPFIDYAGLARSLGVAAFGPIENPADLGPALKKAVDIVKRGEPALVDVVSQGR